jgi:hypothetical protein
MKLHRTVQRASTCSRQLNTAPLELVGDYFADAGQPDMLPNGKFAVRQLDLTEDKYSAPKNARLAL